MTDPRPELADVDLPPDPTGLGIRRPITVPVVPVDPPAPTPPASPVDLPTSYARPVVAE